MVLHPSRIDDVGILRIYTRIGQGFFGSFKSLLGVVSPLFTGCYGDLSVSSFGEMLYRHICRGGIIYHDRRDFRIFLVRIDHHRRNIKICGDLVHFPGMYRNIDQAFRHHDLHLV